LCNVAIEKDKKITDRMADTHYERHLSHLAMEVPSLKAPVIVQSEDENEEMEAEKPLASANGDSQPESAEVRPSSSSM
jgi:hypothetical protein